MVSDRTAKSAEAALQLVLDDFDEGQTVFQLSVKTQLLDIENQQFGIAPELRVHLVVQRFLQTFTISGQVAFDITGECCRCLVEVCQPLAAELKLLVQRREVGPELLEATEEDEDVEIVDPGAKLIHLDDRIRDAVALELPMRVFCCDDCKGLCSRCGQNLNARDCDCVDEQHDTRWAALAKLKD